MICGGGPPVDDSEWEDDGGQDHVGLNPTGRPRRSSARTRRKKDRRLFKGTPWERPEHSQR